MLFPFRTGDLALASGILHLTHKGLISGTRGPHEVAIVIAGAAGRGAGTAVSASGKDFIEKSEVVKSARRSFYFVSIFPPSFFLGLSWTYEASGQCDGLGSGAK